MNNSINDKGREDERGSLKDFNRLKKILPSLKTHQLMSNISYDSNYENKDIPLQQYNENQFKPSNTRTNVINISTYNTNKMKLGSFYIGNKKSSTQIKGFNTKAKLKSIDFDEIKSRNVLKNSFEKSTKYSSKVKRLSSIFPQLRDKIKSVYHLHESVDLKIGEIKSNFRKLERKYENENLKKLSNPNPDTITIDFKKTTSITKIKNVFYQAIKHKSVKPLTFYENETKPLAYHFSNHKERFPHLEKFLETQKIRKKVRMPKYLRKKSNSKNKGENSFDNSFSNLAQPSKQPVKFLKNLLYCCENIECENENVHNDLIKFKTTYLKTFK